ncbi:MAG: site-specific DNA-methyltransferase [Desulfobacterales bacterium]|nr:site-specific DNA-methyltransferase [Desulfobacterales bacterium]
MATRSKGQKPIEQYEHKDKERLNNPPVGLVNPKTDPLQSKKNKYEYDPHLDPQLQWAGKAEHTSLEVDTVSLHVHERIDPKRIIETVKKEEKGPVQASLFEQFERPLRQAIEFYKHKEGWTNRLIAGDSLLVMNSLLEKEGMGGKVQMVYIDPPYGIKYGSNFQPFVNKRDVKDGKDEDLTAEPEMIKAFRDTWELGIHSYLTYLRDRLMLARELLHNSGSCLVQIGDENIHHVRELLGEVFGSENFFSLITFKKTLPLGSSGLAGVSDYILWYAKDVRNIKYRELFEGKPIGEGTGYTWVELSDGTRRKMTLDEKRNPRNLPKDARVFFTSSLSSSGYTPTCMYDFEFEGRTFKCGRKSWRTHKEGMSRLVQVGRITAPGNLPCFVQYHDDFPVQPLHNLWNDTHGATDIQYVVQTSNKVIQRCLLMATDPGDLVLDPTCGSGTIAYVAEQWGRRWITCDTSRVALTLAKQRLMTAIYDYYELAHPDEGVGSGFKYKTVPHITLKSIANNEPPKEETLYDQPLVDKKRKHITGPFTVEAVPAPVAKSFEEIAEDKEVGDESVTRSGETLRQDEWRQELLKTGIRGKAGQRIMFSRVEPLAGTRYLHAEAETKRSDAGADTVAEAVPIWKPEKVLISFGPEHAPLEQRQVEEAWQEARPFNPHILLFVAFQFDDEAAKDIDEMPPETAGMKFLKVQMNADLLTDDLKKKRLSNESFWLVGQPDVRVLDIKKGEHKGKLQVEVLGFDYYNTKIGNVESGGKNNIAMWMLDTDYDGRSLFPSQVFFPLAGAKEGWNKLARNLKAQIDEERIEAYRGTVSLPFEMSKQIAVKIIDDRGIESLKIMRL